MARDLKIKEENRPTENEGLQAGRSYLPSVDIRETEEALWVWADLPGVDENSIDVRLEDEQLKIEGRVGLAEYESLRPLYTEYNVGHFQRSFRINREIDPERISARLANGVLQLELPKAGRARPRRVAVTAG